MLIDYASAEVSGDWTYTVTDNQATITKYSGSDTEIVVPSTLEGLEVVDLGGDEGMVFFTNGSSPMGIEKVTISEGIKTIGDYAFQSHSSSFEVIIPESVREIEQWAFFITAG